MPSVRRPPLPPAVLDPAERRRIHDGLRDELAEYVPTIPPPPELDDARDALVSRNDTPTGRHKIEELERYIRDQERRAAAEKLAEAREAIAELRRQLEKKEDRALQVADKQEDRAIHVADRKDERRWQWWMLFPAAVVGAAIPKLIELVLHAH